jgi:hypothetical protein
MNTALYHTRLGRPIILRKNQADALIRAGLWLTLGYTYIDASTEEPTYTDDIIGTMIRQYPKVALICKPRHQAKGPQFPFRIVSSAHTERNAWCKSFGAAIQWVRDVHQCDVLFVPIGDMQEDYFKEAEKQRVCLLSVDSIIDAVPALIEDGAHH